MRRRTLRICSLSLTVAMLLNLFPAQVFAEDTITNTKMEVVQDTPPVAILGEMEDLREADTKHFRLSDGSFIAVSYGTPVHYEDENGRWQDIDNSITTEDSVGTYQLNRTDTNVAFSQSLEDGRLLTTSSGEISITMSLLDTMAAAQMIADSEELLQNIAEAGAIDDVEEITDETIPTETETVTIISPDNALEYNRSASGEIINEAPSLLSLEGDYSWDIEDVIPENLQSSLLYENVFPDVDLLYTSFGNNIKEQIVVNSPKDAYRYDFLLELDGLTVSANEDGSIFFMDSNDQIIYRIPTPYMEDGNGITSTAVTFSLHNTAQGLVLTVDADAEWINAEERTFPVKIDPSIAIASGYAFDDIYSVYTMEASPNETTMGRQALFVGASPYSATNDGRYRAFMHFNDMPDIPEGFEVVDAQLSLYQVNYAHGNYTSFPVGVYEVTTSKPSAYSTYYDWFTAMTWNNNMPDYDATNVIDYVMISAGKCYRTWNITELVKTWYTEGTDNSTAALIMMTEEDVQQYTHFASASFFAYAGTYPPTLIVSYRNRIGIEPYYTYATLDGASAGTAYIADATGQLKVGKELASYASSINPFSLSLIYNSDYFALSPSTDYQPSSKLGLSMNVGSGWTLNYIQKVEQETIDTINYLKYTDGDGTIHYFVQVSEPPDSNYPYYDEDGLGLKMKINSTNNYTMADESGNTWTFTNNYLTCVTDANGNKININYSSGKISTITQVNNGQPSITVATFTYSGNYLDKVTDKAGNVFTLTYSSGKLSTIKKNGTVVAAYSYTGYRLNKMTDSESSYALSFSYTNGKISSYKELGGTVNGATVDVTYPSHSQTVYRDYGIDRTKNSSDDILTYYLFDYAGRTANAYTTDSGGNVIGASNAAYTANAGASKQNNRTLRSASIGVAAQQLLRNTSVESTSNAWTFSGATRANTKPRSGSYSVKGTLSSNGTQYARKSSETLTAGATYTFSAYVNTSAVTSFSGNGICLKVSNGSNTWTSNYVNYKTSSVLDGGWVRISLTFKAVTSGTHTVAVYNYGAIGTFYADDFQLEKGEAPSSYNLLENGSMEMGSYGWTMGTGASYSTEKKFAGSTSVKIIGDPTVTTSNASQTITLNLPSTQTYILSGWVHANAVPDEHSEDPTNTTDTSKECGLRAVITYSDSATESHYIPFNPDLSNTWQFASLAVVPKQKAKTVTSIKVVCVYEGNANIAYFDNISLVREVAQTMEYDGNGNLVSVSAPGLAEDTNTYSNGNLIELATGGNGTYTYSYDTTYKHRLTSITNGLITQSMEHDSVGNVTETTLSGSGSQIITTSAEYGGSMNRATYVYDAAGQRVRYGYGNANSQMMALPSSFTDANGTATAYSYDGYYRLIKSSIANVASVDYNYSSGNLTSLVRTDSSSSTQTYNFTYDSFGNMLTLKVGTQTLATYEYFSGNGLLKKQTYANGDTVSYTYDNLGRTKTVTYADGPTLTYVYNGEGRIHSITETKGTSSVTYFYTYDSLGRLISSRQYDGSTSVLQTHQTYNGSNQLTGQSWQMGSTVYSETYTYNTQDGSLNTFKTGAGQTLTMDYDDLRRLSVISGGISTRNYEYRDVDDTRTTMQVEKLNYSGLNLAYEYIYDAVGNIASYKKPSGEKVTYTYDAQGQLLKAAGNTTYNYSYDTVGNILTGNGHTYTYGDSNWKDLLKYVDGQEIHYDASGNPTSYYNGTSWTFGWSNGRQLTSASGNGKAISYTYDGNGLRTSKTVDGVTHNYLYAGGKLLQETYGSVTLYFFYDASGNPYAMKYGNSTYYYILNLQGDVMKLVTSAGTEVASYDYDPYGNIIDSDGSLAGINPLRYRGYYYDKETGLYYVSSRYYDPEIGRFINADDTAYLGADGTPLSYNLFAYCKNNPVNGYDPTGHWDWNLFGKVLVTTVVVVGCLTGVGAIAAAAAAATATSVAAAVTVSVATAGVSTALSAVDGAICAQQSGGKWYDGAMAGAIGGSAGALVSSITNPTPGSDAALRMNIAGRVTSSLLYDVSYDLFSSGEIKATNLTTYAIDVTMDATLAPINYYYTGNLSNGYLRSSINGLVDGAIDVFQTIAYFIP